jgi:hypothetical protein
VHPYAEPLSIRDTKQLQHNHGVDTLGGTAGDVPLPVAAIVLTTYRPGAQWHPNRCRRPAACLPCSGTPSQRCTGRERGPNARRRAHHPPGRRARRG